jgi:hypothetical protein
MSVHVLRAHGYLFSELTQIFRANPARFHEILHGRLHPDSWEKALQSLAIEDVWNEAVKDLVDRFGLINVIEKTQSADPRKRQFAQRLKRARKFAPVVTLSRPTR